MQHALPIILTLSFVTFSTFCFSQNVVLNSQSDVDGFDSAITVINGNLSIETTDDADPIVDLSNLGNLVSITGQLEIQDNDALLNLAGVENINFIGNNLRIRYNDLLKNIEEFDNIESIAGYVLIQKNDTLETISGFENLTSISGYFRVLQNKSLTQIEGFNNLNTINGDFKVEFHPLLTAIKEFNSLTTISGNLFLNGNLTLGDIDAFSNLTTLTGELAIHAANGLINLDAFSNLSSTLEALVISSNDNLSNIDGLSNLNTILGSISISRNPKLLTINVLENVTNISGNLFINENNWLTNLDGLINLTNVSNISTNTGNVTISDNNGLTDLDGLKNLSAIAGDLKIIENDNLVNCCAIQTLLSTPSAISGFILIEDNPSECSSESQIIAAFCDIAVSVNFPCLNIDNGSIQVQIASTAAPFAYSWERIGDGVTGMGISNSPNFNIENLGVGTYNLIVVDAAGEEFIENDISLIAVPGSVFEILLITSTNSSNGESNGEINITVSGGIPPYTFSWTGLSSGMQMDVIDPFFTITDLAQGEYDLLIIDGEGQEQSISVSLLDDIVPVFECSQPLDIVILNDVSGSVDLVEYDESKQFFTDFISAINIGIGAEDSRAAIIEWAGNGQQSIKIPMTSSLPTLQNYTNASRSFSGGTSPHDALIFGESYLANNSRPDVAKVLVLSTDGVGGQISPSLVGLADTYKAQGYHIVTIAFDDAFEHEYTRSILQQVASVGLLAPGAPAYAQLSDDLAETIVTLYLCPINPGSSATAYFNRDGAIDIIDIQQNGDCEALSSVDLTFTIEALRELSIPPGTPVSFYYNNPTTGGSTFISNWQVPCAIPVGTTETFTVNIPLFESAHIFAVFNDDGISPPPIYFPRTSIWELAYSNNIADTTICLNPIPTLQAFKSTTTPKPVCNNTVIYTINVCNISSLNAMDITVTDVPPTDFILLNTIVNENGCATNNGNTFDIPANCCVSMTLTYDASNAENGTYNDQDVLLSGANNQVYQDFNGAITPNEDVTIDGTTDCPSTTINFTKEVNVTEICEDAYVVYTFYIDNQLNIPLQNITFSDILPSPTSWVFQPYDLHGLTIGNPVIEEMDATFIIDYVEPNTIASFSMDAYVGDWENDGVLDNTAVLEQVIDLENSGLQSLLSNTTTTHITANPDIIITQAADCSTGIISLTATLDGATNVPWSWITTGDGTFENLDGSSNTYTLGSEDLSKPETILSVSTFGECSEINHPFSVYPVSSIPVTLELLACEDLPVEFNGTPLLAGDEQTFIFENSYGCDSLVTVSIAEGGFSAKKNMPNAFTPNQDGINDCFGPAKIEDLDFKTYSLFIYNRWGKQIFTTMNPDDCWNGEVNGIPAPADVYIWQVEAETTSCEGLSVLQGDVTLIR